jgi:hypothetical protein
MSGQKNTHQKLLQLDLCDPLDQLVRCHEDTVGLGHGSQPEPLAWLVGVCQSHKKREDGRDKNDTLITIGSRIRARSHTPAPHFPLHATPRTLAQIIWHGSARMRSYPPAHGLGGLCLSSERFNQGQIRQHILAQHNCAPPTINQSCHAVGERAAVLEHRYKHGWNDSPLMARGSFTRASPSTHNHVKESDHRRGPRPKSCTCRRPRIIRKRDRFCSFFLRRRVRGDESKDRRGCSSASLSTARHSETASYAFWLGKDAAFWLGKGVRDSPCSSGLECVNTCIVAVFVAARRARACARTHGEASQPAQQHPQP